MARFVVLDVETPNRHSNRMSAIGITVVEDGSITEEFYSLVNPETYFDYFNTQLTGINENTVIDAPTFPALWPQIEPLMESGLLVAHNAVFDDAGVKSNATDCSVHTHSRIYASLRSALNGRPPDVQRPAKHSDFSRLYSRPSSCFGGSQGQKFIPKQAWTEF